MKGSENLHERIPEPVNPYENAEDLLQKHQQDKESFYEALPQVEEEELLELHEYLITNAFNSPKVKTEVTEQIGSVGLETPKVVEGIKVNFTDGTSLSGHNRLMQEAHFTPFDIKTMPKPEVAREAMLLGIQDFRKCLTILRERSMEFSSEDSIIYGYTNSDLAQLLVKRLGFKYVSDLEIRDESEDFQDYMVDGKVASTKGNRISTLLEKTRQSVHDLKFIMIDSRELFTQDRFEEALETLDRAHSIIEERTGITPKEARITAIKHFLNDT